MPTQLSPKRERFAQLVALGTKTHIDAYCEAFNYPVPAMDAPERKYVYGYAYEVLQSTDVKLRIQELRRPVIRKMQREYVYTLQDALRECKESYELAYANGNVQAMLKAVELQGKFVKILTDTVEHKHGLLDDTATAVLLEMKRRIELEKKEAKRIAVQVIDVTPETGIGLPVTRVSEG